MKLKKYFKTALILFLAMSVFFGISYLYLYKNMQYESKSAEKSEENIPYYDTPQNCGVVFLLENSVNILIYLDFEKEISYIIDMGGSVPKNDFGYTADYKIKLDYYTASSFIDRIGGIDIKTDGENLRYTGIQVCDCVREDASFLPLVMKSVCEKISDVGISLEDLVFLIKNSDTDMTVPVCFYWPERLGSLFSNAIFVNWEF